MVAFCSTTNIANLFDRDYFFVPLAISAADAFVPGGEIANPGGECAPEASSGLEVPAPCERGMKQFSAVLTKAHSHSHSSPMPPHRVLPGRSTCCYRGRLGDVDCQWNKLFEPPWSFSLVGHIANWVDVLTGIRTQRGLY